MTLEREQVGCICILGVYHITRNFQERKISHIYQMEVFCEECTLYVWMDGCMPEIS